MSEFIITEQLDAPVEKVFAAWANPDQLEQWWGPKGWDVRVKTFYFHPEGLFHYSMHAGDGTALWGRFRFVEIEAPRRIVFINSFSDEAGGITRAPFEELWPLEMHNTLTLEGHNGSTTLTLAGRPENASPEEEAVYGANHESMRQGFGGTFERLRAFLAAH